MPQRVATRPGVVSLESFIDIRGTTDVVPRRIDVASEDVDKSSANAVHVNGSGMFRASENQEEFSGIRCESIPK